VSRLNSSPADSSSLSFAKPILCYVTDRRSLRPASSYDLIESLVEKIEEIAVAGVDWIQLREKDLSEAALAALTREALARVSRQSSRPQLTSRIVVNDRLDVALAERAGGIHLGENSVPVGEAKRLVRSSRTSQTGSGKFLLGVSCHSLEAAQSAASAGADYIFFGPIFPTPSKAAYGAPQGLERLAQVCSSLKIPVLAIGGITSANAASCLSAGASGIAAIRLFQDATDPATIFRALRQTNP
jgi:thiamine-phosphate pyrophosphorylase